MRKIAVIVGFLLVANSAYAQAQTVVDACTIDTGPFVLQSGAPFSVAFVMDAKVPISTTNPTLVDQRVDGIYYQIDSQTIVTNMTPTKGVPCPAGNVNAGKIPYIFQLQGVTRGEHTIRLWGWNYKLDSNGLPTTTRQEGAPTITPFTVVDPTHETPPTKPTNVIIRR